MCRESGIFQKIMWATKSKAFTRTAELQASSLKLSVKSVIQWNMNMKEMFSIYMQDHQKNAQASEVKHAAGPCQQWSLPLAGGLNRKCITQSTGSSSLKMHSFSSEAFEQHHSEPNAQGNKGGTWSQVSGDIFAEGEFCSKQTTNVLERVQGPDCTKYGWNVKARSAHYSFC